ncbi:MAG: extracellular solute-binding protein family 1 [Eubacterium sp.]|nr:extracellular solute-binding protein family 1 [Eubacterium sp.]
MRKRILVIIIILAALISSCSIYYINKRQKTVTLEFGMFAGSNWGVENANSYVIIDKAIKQFENRHKNVKIHYYSGIVKDDYSEWFSRQVLLGKTPDVFMILTNDFEKFSALNIMKKLDTLIQKDDKFNSGDFYSTTLNTGVFKDNQYALPYETVPTLMFVNKTLLEKEGIQLPDNNWTWDDLYNICKKITKDTNGDKILDQFGTYNYDWLEAVYTNGANLFDRDGKHANFTDQKVIDAIKFAKQINDINQGQKVIQDDFDSGNVAFMPLLFSDYRTYKTYPYKLKKYANFQWDCITLPAGENGGNISEVNTLLMGISDKTEHEELSWEFLKQLTYDEDIQMDIFRYSQGSSVLKNVVRSKQAEAILREDIDDSDKIIDNGLLSQVIENGIITPKFHKYEESISLAQSEVEKIINQNKNIDSTLKIFQRKINQYLKR